MSLVNLSRASLSSDDIVGNTSTGFARYVNSSPADIQLDFPMGTASFSACTLFNRKIPQCNPKLRFILSKIAIDLSLAPLNGVGGVLVNIIVILIVYKDVIPQKPCIYVSRYRGIISRIIKSQQRINRFRMS